MVRASESILPGVRRLILGPLASGAFIATDTSCVYSNQNKDKTATTSRFRRKLTALLATALSY